MFSEYRDYKQFLIYIYDPLIFDLMTLKSTQFISYGDIYTILKFED